ncbi:MAG: hypothetical protein IJJ68_02985 [Prevotella sp.]|nr:hypothetical protein [Prevotella sp.]
MNEQEFEKIWRENRRNLLQNDAEWRQLQESYKMSSGADWLLFAIPVVAGIASFNYIPLTSEILKWLVSVAITIVCFALCVWIKTLISGTKSADEIERRIKEEFKESMHNS